MSGQKWTTEHENPQDGWEAEALKFVSQFLAEGSNDPTERARAIAMIDGALIKAGG